MAPCETPWTDPLKVNTGPFYTSALLSNSTLDFENSPLLTPRTLYAESFTHRQTSAPLPRSRHVSSRSLQIKMRDASFGTTTEDEFEALPLAVQRKYFSTLERLRFARNSGTFSRNNELVDPVQRNWRTASRPGLANSFVNSHRCDSISGGRRLRKPKRTASINSADTSWFLSLPNKIQKMEFTREEQILLSGKMGESVLLDAADQAVYKASRRTSRNLTPMIRSPSISSSLDSIDSLPSSSEMKTSSLAKEMLDSFRWIDEGKDLDLGLHLDDYHANLDGFVLPSPTHQQRPSFRRNISVSKIPFGRSSFSSMNRDHATSPIGSAHVRQKSRTMSIMTAKHGARDSISSIDPRATHYQDPEARLKLRVYLASPQKFDEAIEFGFPSMEGVTSTANKENRIPRKPLPEDTTRKSNVTGTTGSTAVTFLNDDTASLSEDDASMAEPESPVTPHEPDNMFKPRQRVASDSSSKFTGPSIDLPRTRPVAYKPEGYAQSTPGSREMTLRMTLTRPDLRADESKLYGWQCSKAKSPLEEPLAREPMPTEKYQIKGPMEGDDGWGLAEKDGGVVRRFWNKVKSSQRKSS